MTSSVRNVWIAFAGLLGFCVLVWLAVPEREDPLAGRPIAGREDGSSSLPSADRAIEDPTEPEVALPSSREVVAAPAAVEEAAESQEGTETNVARLNVLVRGQDDGAPRVGVRVAAFTEDHFLAIPVGESHGEVGEAPVTDAEGRAELQVEAGQPMTVSAHEQHSSRSVEREVDPIVAGETLELVLELGSNVEDVRLHGQLVDAENGAPLVGFVSIERHTESGLVVTTTPDGRFELSAGSWQHVFASAWADGHARTVFAVAEGHDDPLQPLIVRLSRSATLDVFVRDREGAPVADARVRLTTDSYELQQPDETILDSYFSADLEWKGETDVEGRATIADLPPNVPLSVETAAKQWPSRKESAPLTLEPGEQRSVEIVLGAGAALVGSLVDTNGSPITGRVLWRVAPEEDSRPTLFESYESPVEESETDAEGRFRFESVPGGTWWIGPAPLEDDVPPLAESVEVSEEFTEVEIVLRVARGLFLEGRVLDPAGQPAAECMVSAHVEDWSAWVNADTGEDGGFSLGPIPAGTWVIQAQQMSGSHAPSEELEVVAGQSDIALQLRVGGAISGEVVDAVSGERRHCELTLTSTESESWLMTGSEGTFQFDQLLPGHYAVTALTRDGKIGVGRTVTVTAGGLVEGLRVEVSKGAQLELRHEGPTGNVHCKLLVDGTYFAMTSLQGKKPELVTVPQGSIEVRWRGPPDYEIEHTARIDVGTEGRHELVLGDGSADESGD